MRRLALPERHKVRLFAQHPERLSSYVADGDTMRNCKPFLNLHEGNVQAGGSAANFLPNLNSMRVTPLCLRRRTVALATNAQ